MNRVLTVLGLVLGAGILLGILYLSLADFSQYKPRVEAAVSIL